MFEHLRKRLIERRKELDLTQLEVAIRMGTTQSAISELESNTLDPRFMTVMRWARALDYDLRVTLQKRK